VGDEVPYRIRVLAGMTGIILILALVTASIRIGGGAFSGGYSIRAVFTRAGQGLYDGSDVKVRGVTVGSVKSIKLDTNGDVTLTLHLHSGVRVADTVSASIEPLSVFGPSYVDLAPGVHELAGPFVSPGYTITHTVPATDLFDVLDRTYGLFAAIDPNDLATVVQTVGDALDGMGPDLAQTIDGLKTIAVAARSDIPSLQTLVVQLGRLTTALAPHAADLPAIAASLNQVLPSIASQPDQVSALLDNVSQVASDLAGVLETHAPAVNQIVNGLGTVVDTLYDRRTDVPPLVASLGQFFAFLAGIIHSPGEAVPYGKLPGNIQGFIPDDPCVLFVGLCPGS
jgi:phospholipid/cholesterol/gamma-HCH transport system substrate-binding protein